MNSSRKDGARSEEDTDNYMQIQDGVFPIVLESVERGYVLLTIVEMGSNISQDRSESLKTGFSICIEDLCDRRTYWKEKRRNFISNESDVHVWNTSGISFPCQIFELFLSILQWERFPKLEDYSLKFRLLRNIELLASTPAKLVFVAKRTRRDDVFTFEQVSETRVQNLTKTRSHPYSRPFHCSFARSNNCFI